MRIIRITRVYCCSWPSVASGCGAAALADACARSTWLPHTGLADFRHYVEKHRPQCGARIVAYEPVNQPTEPELLAMARRYFQKYDLMAGTPTPL